MRSVALVVAAALSASCGDAEVGYSCFSGSCTRLDGGVFAVSDVCGTSGGCNLPDDAVTRGEQDCHRFFDSADAGCAATAVVCKGLFQHRPDWEDCYHPP
jgi:hypothetical protein